MSTQLVRLAAAVLSSEKGRKTVGWVLAAILSPVILLAVFLCCVGSGTAEHNGAVVSAAFYGTELSESVPTEYRTQLTQIGDALTHASGSEAVKLSKQQKKIQEQSLEIQKYEEKIHHLADQNIEIDLDDGVKYNYALFEDVLAKIK